MEKEMSERIPFLDRQVSQERPILTVTVHRKWTHTVHCLNHCSNNPLHVKKGVIQNLCNRAIIICQQKQDLREQANKLKWCLLLSGYAIHFIKSTLNTPMEISCPKKSEKALCISIWEPVWSSSLSGIYKMSEQSSKHNIPSGVHSWKLNHQEVRNTWHIGNTTSHVYMAGIMLGELHRQLATQLHEQRQNLKQGHP